MRIYFNISAKSGGNGENIFVKKRDFFSEEKASLFGKTIQRDSAEIKE